MIIKTLSKTQDNGVKDWKISICSSRFISDKMINISKFTGLFFQQFYRQDKLGLFAYLCNKLRKNNSFNIILLSEVIGKMTGCKSIDDFSKAHLQSLAGGSHLKIEAAALMSEMKSARNSSKALERFFWDETKQSRGGGKPSLAFVLMCLLAQQRIKILH